MACRPACMWREPSSSICNTIGRQATGERSAFCHDPLMQATSSHTPHHSFCHVMRGLVCSMCPSDRTMLTLNLWKTVNMVLLLSHKLHSKIRLPARCVPQLQLAVSS